MTETELKSIIDRETYQKVKEAFKWQSVKTQTNYYYTDREDALREKRIMVRVREVDGRFALQVKLHKNENSPMQICDEREFEIDSAPDIIDTTTAKKITGEDVGELYKMGSAKTKRRTFTRSGSELCLDKTVYFDKTDYEVEVEFEEKMSAEIFMRLTVLGVKFDKVCVGKFSRFLDEYKKRASDER